ncbi:MAG: peptidoglycan DD-metalloendopeptidase family protein [Bacteroidota bacterium]
MFRKGGILVAALALLFSCDSNNKESDKNNDIANSTELENIKEPDIFEFGIKANDYKIIKGKVEKNQTFGEILLKQNIGYPEIHKIAGKSKGIYNIRKIQRNKNYTLLCKDDSLSTAEVMIYQPNAIDYVIFDLRDSINIYKESKEIELREREVSGIISSSLSQALEDQGIDYRVSNSLSEIYAWTVDFFRLQKGDYFKLVFDEKYIDDTTYVGIGPIKAAEFNNNGQSFYSFYFDKGEFPEYFDENGRNLRKAFLKAPLKYGTFRISSRYSGRRFHPVQHRWKAHLGTDYAAPTGTPIISTANGTVVKSAYTRSNGHYVKVKHNSTYSTQYLHMSKRAVKAGQTVRQGQVIGYVGMTGLATGPHVCYRFWKNGKQVDALRQKLPDVKPIGDEIKVVFEEEMTPMKARLDNISLPLKFEADEVVEGEVVTAKE